MWKQNKGKVIVTSLVTLLPCLIGLVLWPRLPEQVPLHFNFNGVADDWGSKTFAIFALPGFMFVCHLICTVAMLHDPKGANIGEKIISIFFWVVPVTSLVTSMCLYAYALNLPVNIAVICMILMGILYIILGNIMPKLKPNYTIGIKIAWTLSDEENWYHTHRIAGWCMVIAGVLLVVTAFSANLWIVFFSLLLSSCIPIAYSFIYYKRHNKT